MTLKPEYTKYKHRLFKGFLSVVLLSIIWTVIILLNDIGRVGNIVVLSIFSALTFIQTLSVLRKSKNYLTEIQIENDTCKLTIYEYDRQKEVIKTNIAETRIKIWEIFFPFNKFGRNYKLVVETKQGLSYRRIFQQYEIGS